MAIQEIRLPNGETLSLEEWLHWPLYSTIEGAAGSNVQLMCFTYTVGQQVPQAGVVSTGRRIADESDTNQVVRARINHDEAFVVFSWTYEHFALEGSTNQDSVFANPPLDDAAVAPILRGTNLRLMQRDLLVELLIGANITKPMARSPMAYIGQGIGAVAWGSGDALAIANGAATSLNLNYGTGGYISPKNQRLWNLPVFIASDRVTKVKVSSPAGPLLVDQDWRLKFWLDGLKRRPVA